MRRVAPLWLLVITVILVVEDQHIKEPDWWKLHYIKHDLKELRDVLSPSSYTFFRRRPRLVQVLRASFREALDMCLFTMPNPKYCRPNGKHYSLPLFSFPLDSFPGGVLLALTTSSLIRSISISCSTGELRACRCANVDLPQNKHLQRGTCKFGMGQHNLAQAVRIARKLIFNQYRCTFPSMSRDVILNNIALGTRAVTLYSQCSCAQPGYGCFVRECSLKICPMITVMRRLASAFRKARRTSRENYLDYSKMCDKKRKKRGYQLMYIDDTSSLYLASFYLGVPR